MFPVPYFCYCSEANRSAPASLACCFSGAGILPSCIILAEVLQNRVTETISTLDRHLYQNWWAELIWKWGTGNILPLSQREGCIKLLPMLSRMGKGNNPTSFLCYRQIPKANRRFVKNCGRAQCPARGWLWPIFPLSPSPTLPVHMSTADVTWKLIASCSCRVRGLCLGKKLRAHNQGLGTVLALGTQPAGSGKRETSCKVTGARILGSIARGAQPLEEAWQEQPGPC